ncbi:MAG: hypothetical protein R6V03_02150 [Kiritimatiellia bacterium]
MKPEKSSLFTPHTCKESGVISHILTERVAPVQEAFYFVNDGSSRDGRYLWFYCAYPPSGTAHQGRTLGVVNFETETVRNYPETQFSEASPYVVPETGEVFWGLNGKYWRRRPEPEGEVKKIGELPADWTGDRRVLRSATHLTRSADGKEIFIDCGFELQWRFGSLSIETGEMTPWRRFDRLHNHAQFSPTDPDMALFAQENHRDPVTGLTFRITDRMHLIRRGEAPRPLFPNPTRATHEWWDSDGRHVWYIAWQNGHHSVWRASTETAETAEVWPGTGWHAHDSGDGRAVVADHVDNPGGFYRGAASSVHFLNRETGGTVCVARNPARTDYAGKYYHIDPHPRFLGGGRYIIFTTTVLGNVDLALVSVDELFKKTA